jgi:peroxiredoxin Q/BCP
MLKVGDVAPDFSVPDHNGKTRRLTDYSGKTVVIWFYPKADTPG